MMEKSQLRKQMKKALQTVDKASAEVWQQAIYEQLFACKAWQDAHTIGVTLSMAFEIDTEPIIMRAWQEGKMIAVPKVDTQRQQLIFYHLRTLADVTTGFRNIREPLTAHTTAVDINDISLLIVPGLCFDGHSGYRIGFGGGFYDRLLQHYQQTSCALAFDFQLCEDMIVEAYDQPVDALITPTRFIKWRQ